MLKLSGKLAVPRFSRNGNLYFPEELATFNGKTIPLRWFHQGAKSDIGEAHTTYDKALQEVNYTAIVTNAQAEAMIRANPKAFKTSLGAKGLYDKKICHDTGKCYNAPMGLTPIEMSVVDVPGIPQATLNIAEGVVEEIKMESEFALDITSDTPKIEGLSMTDKTEAELKAEADAKALAEKKALDEAKAKTEADAKAKLEADAKAAKEKSEADAKALAEKITKTEAELAELKTKNEALESDKALNKAVEERVATEMAKVQAEIREKFVPKSTQASGKYVEEGVDEQIAELKKVLETGYAKIEIDLQAWLEAHTQKSTVAFKEGVSTSGTIPGIGVNSDIVVLPGGVSDKPIRQWCQFKEIAQGEDKQRFYTIDIPAFTSITETIDTDITPSTHTLTSIDVTADTPRGFRQTVKKTEIEKYPAGLLDAIRTTARIRAIQDEANIVLTTAGSTSNDYGSNHFSGSDGVAVTTTTLEDATGEFTKVGIERAKQRLDEVNQPTAPGDTVIAMHPRAYRTMVADSTLTSWVQIGDPSMSRLGRVQMYFGTEILITTNLVTSSNSYRNILWVKGKAFAIASGRTLEIEFFKDINKQNVSIVATHRTGAGILDATAYVILSSKAD